MREAKSGTAMFHQEQIRTKKDLDKQLKKLLSSGQTNVSKFNLDLVRRQRSIKNGDLPSDAPSAPGDEVLTMADIIALANYDDNELERFLAEI